MFERFDPAARQAVILSQDEARELGHGHIGTEHLLLGLLRVGRGPAGSVLAGLGLSLERVRSRVAQTVGRGVAGGADPIPFTPHAQVAFELAAREAVSLGHHYIGMEHILLGLVREGHGVAAGILFDAEPDADRLRNEIVRRTRGRGRRTADFLARARRRYAAGPT